MTEDLKVQQLVEVGYLKAVLKRERHSKIYPIVLPDSFPIPQASRESSTSSSFLPDSTINVAYKYSVQTQ